MTKVEPGKAAEPRTGTLPKTEQQRRDAASSMETEPGSGGGSIRGGSSPVRWATKQNLRSGLVKAHQIAFATPNRANSKPDSAAASGGHAPSSRVIPGKPLSLFGGSCRARDTSSPRTPDRTPALLRPGLSGRTQTAGLAQPQAAAAEVEAARRRIEARLQAKERRLRVTLKSICTGC